MIHLQRRWRLVLGVVCIILGLIAFFTPLTPGSWLVFVGLELLGVRMFAKVRKEDRTKSGEGGEKNKEEVV